MRSRAKLYTWLLLIGAGSPLLALAAGPPDVRVVIDVSAATEQADPGGMRASAVSMLLQMLPEDAHGGVWRYADEVEVLVPHAVTDRLWKQLADIHLARIAAGGVRSDLLEALTRASWDAAMPSDRSRHIVLLASGKIDIGDDSIANAAARDRLLLQVLPNLRDLGFKIHALALSRGADVALLRTLARDTGGTYALATTMDQVRPFLLKVLDNVAMSPLLPVTADGGFRVDSGVRELTVLRLRGSADATLTLLDPGGKLLSRKTPRSEVRWHEDQGYDLVSLSDPIPGVWRFQSVASGSTRVVALGDLSLQLAGVPGILFPGGPRAFELYLLSNGRRLTDPDFFKLIGIRAQLEGPRGAQPLVVEARADGGFDLRLLEVKESGDHVLRVSVVGPTFQRELIRSVAVRNPVTLDVRPAPDGAVVWVEVNAAGLEFRTLSVAAKVRQPPAPARLVPAQAMPGGLWKIKLSGTRGVVDVSLDISGNLLNKKEFVLKTEPLNLTFPVREATTFNLDSSGRLTIAEPVADATAAAGPRPGLAEAPPPAPAGDDGLRLPLWFVLLIAVLNVCVVGVLWLLLKPPAGPSALPEAVAELTALLTTRGEPA